MCALITHLRSLIILLSSGISGAYYFKTCDVVHLVIEKCCSIDTIQELHVLKVGHHTTGSAVCE